MKISQNVLKVKKYFESCRLTAYPDPGSKDGHPWTIGWGHTGQEVIKGLVWTQQKADQVLLEDIAIREKIVLDMVKVPINQGQFDALVDIVFNVGTGKKGVKDGIRELKNGNPSTLLRKLNTGDFAGAAEQFLVWNKNDGKVMLGLTRRRVADQMLFLGYDADYAIKRAQEIK